jgi:hypothetical protein
MMSRYLHRQTHHMIMARKLNKLNTPSVLVTDADASAQAGGTKERPIPTVDISYCSMTLILM